TSRFGNPRDFQFMVNHLHERGIGVIIDWVGAHFPIDTYALAQFDGSYLFEHEEMGRHPHWDTLHFNYGCKQVANFLICSALFWCDVMHVDGLRLDAVASMIYLDFGRDEGQWQPNCEGGNTNLEAISLLKKLNSWIHTRFPGVMTIAEESHAFPGVTHPVEKNGLGFDFTWAMGWMNDTLRYFETEGEYRSAAHNLITFYMQYASTERFLFPLSHDEVVHEKKSLLEKMPGEEKFAQLKMLLLLMYTLPGKQLLFMGGEFGQRSEWFESEGLHWNLLEVPEHAELKKFSERLGQFYLEHEPLWWRDYDPSGFEWLECDEGLAYYRSGDHGRILVVFNIFPNCKCPVPKSKTLFSTLENNEDNLLELPLYSAAIFEA
ncbi:MAG: alpha-amylase family glycosyl hydrolase, partial [Simkaniaceae bacterium]|nr:alpha-amylase family glycosyl hydrolase [Simkaniaceae bacterium]